jgi:hypothetical protein
MERRVRPRCFVCGQRPAQYVPVRGQTFRDRMAPPLVLFCSRQCAADWAIWWGIGNILDNWHWCEAMGQWERCEADHCAHCAPLHTKEGR